MKLNLIKRLKIARLLKNPDNFVVYRSSKKSWTLEILLRDRKTINMVLALCKTENIEPRSSGKNGRRDKRAMSSLSK